MSNIVVQSAQATPTAHDFLQERRRALRAQLEGLNQTRQGVLMELGAIERALNGCSVPTQRDARHTQTPEP